MSGKIRLVENATDTQTRPTMSHRWLIFLAIALVIVVLLGIFLLSNSTALDGIKRFIHYNHMDSDAYADIPLENYGNSNFCLTDDFLCIGTQGQVTIYAEDGSVLSRHIGDFASAAFASDSDQLLSYDIGGKHLAVLDTEGNLQFEMDTEGLIYDADMSQKGAVCILTDSSECRAVLEVYNESGALLYRRNSKTNYLNACALSPNREFAAAATLGQEDISFCTTVQIFDTASDSAYAEVPLGSQLVYDLHFLDNNTICAVGERSLSFFSTNGTLLGEYSAGQGELMAYSFGGDGFISVLYDLFESSGRYRLVTLDQSGNMIASASLDNTPLSLSANTEYVAVLCDMKLLIFNRELEEQNIVPNSVWHTALVRSDGTAYCIASDEATLLIP